jgi:uncharacterized protein YkwD
MHDDIFATRRRLLTISGLALAAGLAGCSTVAVLKPEPGSAGDETVDALPLVNALRAKSGLSALVAEPQARSAALAQAGRMAKSGKMMHLIGFNDSFLERMKGGGVALPAAENIAEGQDSVTRAVQAWIDSPKHLHNMLGNYRGLGVAIARNPASGNKPYWAMVLSN